MTSSWSATCLSKLWFQQDADVENKEQMHTHCLFNASLFGLAFPILLSFWKANFRPQWIKAMGFVHLMLESCYSDISIINTPIDKKRTVPNIQTKEKKHPQETAKEVSHTCMHSHNPADTSLQRDKVKGKKARQALLEKWYVTKLQVLGHEHALDSLNLPIK